MLFIFCYSLVQGNLVYHYLKANHPNHRPQVPVLPVSLPFVTIQLPIYNELFVIERLMEATADFHYPADRFEIQVLDDSTDETTEVVARKAEEIRQRGIIIHHVRRGSREGFKAGALADGLKRSRGELVAIFDADFIPTPDFLLRTVPYFTNPVIGVVQSRWEHLNADYSLMTQLQAFGLDAHFSVEQEGRNAAGHFINFNGTAGIWRKTCIEDAGGWQSDTLTEDLDLSYRAQLRGWQFQYLGDLGSPAELPVAMNALKTQQFRWTKGAAECARKNLLSVLKSNSVSLSTKIHAFFHLLNSGTFLCVVVLALFSIPVLIIQNNHAEFNFLFQLSRIFLLSLVLLSVFYWVSFTERHQRSMTTLLKFLVRFPLFLSVSMGLSLHNAIAVFEGYIGRKTPYIRTPKFNIRSVGDRWKGNRYLAGKANLLTLLEGLLCLYFIGGIALAFYLHDFGMVPFHLMLAFGFGFVCYYSWVHSRGVKEA